MQAHNWKFNRREEGDHYQDVSECWCGDRQSRRNRASAHQQEDGQKKPLGLDKQAAPNKTLLLGL